LYSLFNKIRVKGKIVSAGYRRGGGQREGAEWVIREVVGQRGEMTQALYAHMNNKTIKKKENFGFTFSTKLDRNSSGRY
jgi:hypothetical protein